MEDKNIVDLYWDRDENAITETAEYSAEVEHPDRFELNSATAQNEQSNRQN